MFFCPGYHAWALGGIQRASLWREARLGQIGPYACCFLTAAFAAIILTVIYYEEPFCIVLLHKLTPFEHARPWVLDKIILESWCIVGQNLKSPQRDRISSDQIARRTCSFGIAVCLARYGCPYELEGAPIWVVALEIPGHNVLAHSGAVREYWVVAYGNARTVPNGCRVPAEGGSPREQLQCSSVVDRHVAHEQKTETKKREIF